MSLIRIPKTFIMIKHFILIVIFACTISCSNDDENINSNSNLYGLGIGNTWTYEFVDMQGVNWQEDTQTITIIGTENIAGEDYFVQEIETTYDDGRPSLKYNDYVRIDQDNYLINSQGVVLAHPTDTTFIGREPQFYGEPGEFEYHRFLFENDITEIVASGTFVNCFSIGLILYSVENQNQVGTGQAEFIYAPNVGLVKEKQALVVDGTFVYEKVLVSYNPN